MSAEYSKGLFVSSDLGLGMKNPQQVEYIYECYKPIMPHLAGVEILAEKNVSRLQKSAAQVRSSGKEYYFHGQTGGEGKDLKDKAKLLYANQLIIPTIELISNFRGSEFLFHSPEVDTHKESIFLARESIKYLWVENHCGGTQALDHAIETVLALRSRGFHHSALVVDWAHLLEAEKLMKASKSEYIAGWERAIEYVIENVLSVYDKNGEPIWKGNHLPFGTDLSDSLDKKKLGNTQIRQLALLNKLGHISHHVLESQHGALHSFRVWKQSVSELQKLHAETYELLDKNGVFS